MSTNSAINAITLEYMMNPKQYEQYVKSKDDVDKISDDDIKFYRKRIIAMTKDMFSKKLTNNDVNDAFDEYVNTCIKYLKFQDRFDIIQSEYSDISDNKPSVDIEYDCEEATKQIFNTPKQTSTLDKFVNIKRVASSDPVKSVIPKKKDIDLTDPKLKKKGLKKKKKKDVSSEK